MAEFPTEGQINWGPMIKAYVDEAVGTATDAVTGLEGQLQNGTGAITTVADAVGEWWIHPAATYQDRPYPRTVFGAIAADGKILACEFNHGTGRTRRYEVGQAGVDDHNAPALWVREGRRPLIVWTNHDQTTYLSVKVGSLSGDLASLVTAPEIQHNTTGSISYAQVHHIEHLSDDDNDVFWVFSRRSSLRWVIVPLTVNQATGATSVGSQVALLQTPPGTQVYLATADAHTPEGENQVIRCALGYNPSQAQHEIYYFEIDCVTGDITSPANPGLTANIDGTGLSLIQDTAMDPEIPDVSEGWSRRLFYTRPGPDSPAIAYADWATTDPDAATYYVREIGGDGRLVPNGSWVTAAYRSAFDDTNGFTYTAIIKTPAGGLGAFSMEVGRRYAGTAGWYLRLTSDKKVNLRVRTSAGDVNRTSTGTVPFAWGDTIGLRAQVDMTTGAFKRFYSLDPFDDTPTWTEIGTEANTVTPGGTITQGTQDLYVPADTSNTATAEAVYLAEFRDASNTVVAAVDWRSGEWDPDDDTYVDAFGSTWELAGTASIIGASVVHDLGISGPRIGYNSTSNYIAGLAFESPSYDRAVIRAASDTESETVSRILLTDSDPVVETLATQPTNDGRLIRPYPPVGGGPFRTVVTNMREYSPSSYTDYEGDVKGLG